MPQIPRINASGQGRVVQLPTPPEEAFGIQAAKDVTGFGGALMRTGAALQAQRDEIDLVEQASAYDLSAQDVKREALTSPGIKDEDRPQFYRDRLAKTMEDLQRNPMLSSSVKTALRSHHLRTLPSAMVDFQHANLTQMKDKNDAEISKVLNEKALSFPTLTEGYPRWASLHEAHELIFRGVPRGLTTQETAEKQWHGFQQQVLESQMNYLRETNRPTLYRMFAQGKFNELAPDKREKIIAQANDEDRKEEDRANKFMNEAQTQVTTAYVHQANRGELSASLIEDAKQGKNPFISPALALRLEGVNKTPPIPGDQDLQVQTAMQLYHGGPTTRSRITTTRKFLNALAYDRPQASQAIDKALNELQTDERTLRTIEAAEMSAKITYAQDEFKAKTMPKLPGKIGQMQENQDKADWADIQMRIHRGEEPRKVLDEYFKRKEKENQQHADDHKDIGNLTK